MLKKTVPMSCTDEATQSMRRGSHDAGLHLPRPAPGSSVLSTLTASEYCRYAAEVKKIEPTKNVTPMPSRGVLAHCAASAATKKHVEPTENSTLIHQLRLRGRHHTRSRAPDAVVSIGWRLRW